MASDDGDKRLGNLIGNQSSSLKLRPKGAPSQFLVPIEDPYSKKVSVATMEQEIDSEKRTDQEYGPAPVEDAYSKNVSVATTQEEIHSEKRTDQEYGPAPVEDAYSKNVSVATTQEEIHSEKEVAVSGSRKKKRDTWFAFSTDAVSLLKKAVSVMSYIGPGNAGVHADEDGIRMQICNANTNSAVIEYEINSKAFTETNLSYKVEKWGFMVKSLQSVLHNEKGIAENLHVTIKGDKEEKEVFYSFGVDNDPMYWRGETTFMYPADKIRYSEKRLGSIEECYEIKASSLCSIMRQMKDNNLTSVSLDICKQNMVFDVSGTKVHVPMKVPPTLLASGVQLRYGTVIDPVIMALEIAKENPQLEEVKAKDNPQLAELKAKEYVQLAIGHGKVVMIKIPVQYGFFTFFFSRIRDLESSEDKGLRE